MAKKILTQEDLRYINNLTAYAIQNPEWFWSDADDASNARQYLYDNGGKGIVDEIYKETPDNIKKTIGNKKLSNDASFNKFHEEWKDKQEDASKVVAGTLAASAAAPFAIGGLTSAASTGALGNAGRYALGKADDAVAWLSKSGTKVYDPRHVVQTLLNPTKAYTGAGQAVASTLDVAGAAQGLKHANDTVKEWENGNFQISDVPQVALDLAGTVPAINYFKQMGVSVPRILTAMYDDTAKAFNDMRNGIEPAYGIRPQSPHSFDAVEEFQNQQALARLNEQLRGIRVEDITEPRLPDPPAEVTIDLNTSNAPQTSVEPPVWSGVNATSLPRNLTRRLQSLGLGRYDVQNLLDRGFTPEQLELISQVDVNTPGLTYNPRANVLARRLAEAGIQPEAQSRMQYLRSLQDQGQILVQNQYGRPMSYSEFISDPSTSHLDPLDYELPHEGLEDYYMSEIPVSRRRIVGLEPYPQYNAPAPALQGVYYADDYSDVMEKLNNSVVTLDDATFRQISPQIQQIVEGGYDSGMTPQEMENQLSALFAQQNRPFFKFPKIMGRTSVSADLPGINPHVMFKPEYRHNWNIPWRSTPYTIDNVPFKVDPAEKRLGYRHWSMFNSDNSDIMRAKSEVFENTPHGGITYEWNKSLQSSPVAHQDYARKAADGKGVIVFMPNDSGGYHIEETNGYAGTIMNPGTINGRLNAPTMVKTFRNNIGQWKKLFENIDPRAYEQYGGTAPNITVNVDGTDFVLKPQFSEGRFVGFDGEDAALRATEALDQRVSTARQPRIDAARQKYENAISQAQAGVELPEGVTWVMTPSGSKLQYVQTSGRFKGQLGNDSVSNFLTNNPQLKSDPKWSQLQNELEAIERQYISDQQFDTPGRFSIIQPVVGFRKFNRGGIIKNLNKNISKLLNM